MNPHEPYESASVPPLPRRSGGRGRFITNLLLLLIVFLLGMKARDWLGDGGNQLASSKTLSIEPRLITPRGDLAADEQATIALFEEAAPSVVYITNIGIRRNSLRMNVTEVPQGTGSGFIWDRDGHIVTNFHVIQGASALEVTLADQSSWRAKVVGFEKDKDLAVLRIDAPKDLLRPIQLGESSNLIVGQKVFAIGNPFGLDQTLTTGVVSALQREIKALTGRPIQDVIQTNAAINPGNSGGPLLDSSGRLIGVNTMIYSPSGASAGIGFSVPVDTVNRIVPDIVQYGRVKRPGLGISIWQGRRPAGAPTGIIVMEVNRGSGAAEAGLAGFRQTRRGLVYTDVIVEIDGEPTPDYNSLYKVLDGKSIGNTVEVTVIRDGQERNVSIELKDLGGG